jgi:hypothetical protein
MARPSRRDRGPWHFPGGQHAGLRTSTSPTTPTMASCSGLARAVATKARVQGLRTWAPA